MTTQNNTPQSLPPPAPAPTASTSQTEIEESVLKDILDQLEKERIKRAEVEAELYTFKKRVEEENEKHNNQSKQNSIAGNDKDDISTTTNIEELSLLLPFTCYKLDEVDRIHKVNEMMKEFTSIQDFKKRSKRTLSIHLTKLFTDIQDVLLEGCVYNNNIVTNPKQKELRIKDEISKVITTLNKQSSTIIWNFNGQDSLDLLKQILHKHTLEFVRSLERLSGIERMKEIEAEMERMKNELITLRIENDGYLELIHALSPNNNAMVVALNDDSNTLPLQVIQLLELMPWDERVPLHIKDFDTYYQWQVYDTKKKTWVDKIDLFPNDEHCSLVPKLGDKASKYQMENQTLPTKKGTWQWIGNWTIDGIPHHHTTTSDSEFGWIYADKPEYIKSNIEGQCFNEANSKESESTTIITRKYRRRRWKRQRVLISYPGISRRSTQFLHVHAENAKLSLSVEKLHDQVFQLQNQLNEKEEDLDKTTVELLSQLTVLELENDKNVSELTKKSKECNELKKKSETKTLINQADDDIKESDGLSKKHDYFTSPIKSWGSKESNNSSNSQQDNRGLSSFFKFQVHVPGTNVNANSEAPVKHENTDEHHNNTEESTKEHNENENEGEEHNNTNDNLMSTIQTDKNNMSSCKVRTPLISLREGDNEDSKHDVGITEEPEVTTAVEATTNEGNNTYEEEEDSTIFEAENNCPEQKERQEKDPSKEETATVNAHDSVVQKIIDPFGLGKKINRESIMKTVKNRVKDVETNVQNVKTNVQAIAGRAQTLQKIASQVK